MQREAKRKWGKVNSCAFFHRALRSVTWNTPDTKAEKSAWTRGAQKARAPGVWFLVHRVMSSFR